MEKTKQVKLIFERSREGRVATNASAPDVPMVNAAELLPEGMVRSTLGGIPEVSEGELMRHYFELSTLNFGVESGFYPLGSCTMKYNPKINEDTARLPGFSMLHPYASSEDSQGALELIYNLEASLTEISGMDHITLQAAAGAQGELCGMLMLAAYFKDKGEKRTKVIIPDTAHGTNPASCALAGFDVIRVASGKDGVVSVDAIEKVLDEINEDVAAIMLTNPNTLGLFEVNIKEISELVHAKGGFVYCDGANLNALMGITKLSLMGVDIVQFNLHKTFSTPHGGGGPGSGPLGVTKELEPFLPGPRVIKEGDGYALEHNRPKSIGRMKAFYGNFSIMVRAYTYILMMGGDGLKQVSEMAILNANYIKEKLKDTFELAYDEPCMHECVFTDKWQNEFGVTTLDIAKRLIDFGVHPPTIYFPLVVDGAIMVEPTETESLETIDSFISAMKAIAKEAKENPDKLKSAPHTAACGRVDEVLAAREPILRWEAKGPS